MPIFHDPQDRPPRQPPSRDMSPSGQRRACTPTSSAIGISLLDSLQPGNSTCCETASNMDQGSSHSQTRKQSAVDRVELIERLKRTKSPVWQQYQHNGRYHRQSPEARSHSHDRPNTPLLSPAQIRKSGTSTPDPLRDIAAAGLEIERPRSALHSGDFRTKEGDGDSTKSSTMPFLATSPVVPWDRSFPPAAYSSHHNNASYSFDGVVSQESHAVSRARAISQSSTSFFAFLPPTSPLVQQANNPDLDLPSIAASRQNSRSPERNNRRHTFSPTSFQPYKSTSMVRSISGTPAARHLRYGSSTPYQAHQPRRSITINQSQSHSNPQTPFLGARRPSFSSEASPLQHAPMVGSYEESILRGRMSTTPSRPLDFVAKIGVLGRGQCKSSLKCPPHVTVPFPAVFYSYNTGNGRISDNEPSPYVGLIDIENSLPAAGESNEPSKRKRRHIVPPDQDDLDFRMSAKDFTGRSLTDDLRKKEKRKRRSTSPKAPPGGSYRIPSQGQLQIVLKNPNNTAVKLFLVPYDISDMESGQKTFIRQRSYSAGPIIDMPMSSRRNLGTDRPEAALSNSEDPNDRPILRYLVHLHMCCPSKGRYYLYKSIRVVFANRVPDGKEKLRNEIQLPEPRFSAYKPMRDSTVSQYMSSTGAQLSNEKAFCRRSAGWPLPRPQQAYDQMDGMSQRPHIPPPAVQFTGGLLSSPASNSFSSPVPTLQPIPFSLTRLAAIESRPVSRDKMDIDIDNNNPFRTPMVSPNSGVGSPANRQGKFEKLNKGDVGYGGNAFTPVGSQTSPPNTGLLSQRLRELEVQREKEKDM